MSGINDLTVYYITRPSRLEETVNQFLLNGVSPDGYAGLDTEGTGLDPHSSKVRLIQIAASDSVVYIIDRFKVGREFTDTQLIKLFSNDKKTTYIGHNLKYDIKMFWSTKVDLSKTKVFDTMLADQIINAGVIYEFSLAEVAERLLKISVDKTEQRSDWSVPDLSSQQLTYAAVDAIRVRQIARIQLKQLKKADLMEVFKLEMRAIFPLAAMEWFGIKVDVDKLNTRLKPLYEGFFNQARIDFLTYFPDRYIRKNLFGEIIDEGIEVTSSSQVLKALQSLSIPDPLGVFDIIQSTGKDVIGLLDLEDYPVIEHLLKHRLYSKALSSYVYAIPQQINPVTSRLHPYFNQCVSTGRVCIAKGTQITTVGGYKNIEDIIAGDLVYTYTEQGHLTIRKVLNSGFMGVKECVKVKWQSSGKRHLIGEVICTPDHKFKTKYKGWVEAKDLVRYDKVYHLSRRFNKTGNHVRPRLYGTNSFMKLEQEVIKTEYFNADSRMCIHHIDEDPANNNLSNLEVLTNAQHAAKHFTKNTSPDYKVARMNLSKFTLLRMLYQAGGQPTKVEMNFTSYVAKCKTADINLHEVCKRFNNDGLYISKTRILEVLNYTNKSKAATILKLGIRRLNELCEYYGIDTNHSVLSVKEYGLCEVYDLEIEDTNCFIAGELCVHNSSNWQQMPRPQGNLDDSIRSCFIPEDGYKFVASDFSQVELRVIAEVIYQDNGDSTMLDEFLQGKDPYANTAALLSGMTYEQLLALEKPEYKKRRQGAKPVRLGYSYAMGAKKFKNYAQITYGVKMTQKEAENNRKLFFEAYPGLSKYHDNFKSPTVLEAYTLPPYNRRRRWLEYPGVSALCNMKVQGGSADITKLAMADLYEHLYDAGYSPTQSHDVKMLLQIHDELVLESTQDKLEYSKEIISKDMITAGEVVLKYCPVLAESKVMDNLSQKD